MNLSTYQLNMRKQKSIPLSQRKIVYIHKSGRGWGGAQQNLFDLINQFRTEFAQTVFICNRGLLLEKIKTLGVKTYQIPIASVKMFPITLIILAIVLIKEKPDIVHSNHRYATLLVQLIRKICTVQYKILHTARSVFTTKTLIRLFGDTIIANSKAVQKNLLERFHIAPEKIKIIYDGVKLNFKSPILSNQQNDPLFQMLDSSQKIIIGCIGSLVKAKGHCYLLQALAQLPFFIQNKILVLIVGEGSLRKKLENKVQDLDLFDIVKFLGFRKDIHHIISYCNFIVIPSIQEGLPNVLIEGYLLAKPAIVSELDYVHELITPCQIGLTFPIMDIKKLAESIQLYVEKPKLVAKHGAKGQKSFKNWFSMEKNIANYSLAYQDLLELKMKNNLD